MRVTEVVQAADDIHAGFQGFGFAHQGAGFASQAIETLAKGGVEPFDESGIDRTVSLGLVDQALYHLLSALNDAPGNVQLTVPTLLDDLGDGNIRPGNQPGASLFAVPERHSRAKRVAKGGDVADQAIHCQKQGTAQGHALDLVGQSLNQVQVSVDTDHTA